MLKYGKGRELCRGKHLWENMGGNGEYLPASVLTGTGKLLAYLIGSVLFSQVLCCLVLTRFEMTLHFSEILL